jgi:hypothetical protein
MKVLLLGNPYFGEDLAELGHEVKTARFECPSDVPITRIPAAAEEIFSALPFGWNPDLVLLGDESTHPLVVGLETLDVPLAWYAIDSHIHLQWHRAYAAVFDVILVAQRDVAPQYQYDPSRQAVHWFPLFCHPRHARKLNLPKQHELCFVGTLNPRLNPDRVRFIRAIQERFPIYVATGDYVEVFNRSKVVLNQCVAGDINFRTFEVLGCGSLLLMERVGNGLEDLFQDRMHLVLYDKGNVEQVVELTRYYAEHEAEREAIAAHGREAVLKAHTSRFRAETLLARLRSLDVTEMIRRRKAARPEIRFLLGAIYEYTAQEYRMAARRATAPAQAAARLATADRYDDLTHHLRRTSVGKSGPPCSNEAGSVVGGQGGPECQARPLSEV